MNLNSIIIWTSGGYPVMSIIAIYLYTCIIYPGIHLIKFKWVQNNLLISNIHRSGRQDFGYTVKYCYLVTLTYNNILFKLLIGNRVNWKEVKFTEYNRIC